MIPYFYIIQHKQTKIYYAGCRYARNCNPSELLTEGGYLTSSRVVNELIREEGIDAFAIRRIRTLSSDGEALEYETRFLQKVDARNNERFYNRSNNIGFTKLTPDAFRSIMLERYGVDTPFKSPEIQDKIRQTFLENHGVDSPLKSPLIQDKIRQTNLERYGFENPMQAKEVQDKARQTNLERYGVDHYCKTEEGRNMASERQKGAKHHSFKGWYITPEGRFASLGEIRDSATELGTAVLRWCINSSKVISKHMYDCSSYLNTTYDSSIIGKTFKELGFGFEEV